MLLDHQFQPPYQNKLPLLRAGIDYLINNFPYPQYSDDEIVNMFTECEFSLESNDKVRLKIIKHFRSLNKV
jgi:hypothetical protein